MFWNKSIKNYLLPAALLSQSLGFAAPENQTVNEPSTKWWDNAIVYEIWPRSFQDTDGDGFGDFKGMQSRLPYLADLGVDAIWLTPIFEAPSYHGYDFQDFYSVEKDYGTMADLEEFLKAAKEKNIKVLADLVINHISNEHPWFIKSAKMEAEFSDLFVWSSKEEIIKQPWAKPWDVDGESTWQWVWHYSESRYETHKKLFPDFPEDQRPVYYYGVFEGTQPDLNFDNPLVVEKIKDIAKFWLEKGFSGFRLDAARYLHEEIIDGKLVQAESPKTMAFWKDFSAYVKSIDPDAYLVGEIWQTNETISKYADSGLDAAFDFAFSNELVYALTGELLVQDKGAMFHTINFTRKLGDALANNLKSKTETGTPLSFYSTFLSNHDQLRFALQVGQDDTLMKLAASVLFTMPGTPYMYYGEEIGISQPDYPDASDRFDDIFKRSPMFWDNTDSLGFSTSSYNWVDDGKWVPWRPNHKAWWDGYVDSVRNSNPDFDVASQLQDENSLLNYYKKLIKIRKGNPEFMANTADSIKFLESNGDVAVYRRNASDGKNSSIVIVNPSASAQSVKIDKSGNYRDLISGQIIFVSDKELSVNVSGVTTRILKKI